MNVAIPTENWPKTFLLQIHAEAVRHGFIWIEPISEADALSLRQRLYRIRRRSDAGAASFIPPEYHLVMVGRWENNRLPIIFNALPDGRALPGITPATGEEIAQLAAHPPLMLSGPEGITVPLAPEDLQLDEGQIKGLVKRMKTEAQKKVN